MEKFNSYITKLLIMLGFAPRHNGFTYIREMLWYSYNGNEKLTSLYIKLSALHNQMSSSIKTAVRNALRTAQYSNKFGYINTLLGSNIISATPLSPAEFIYILTEYLKHLWDGNV